MKHKSMRPSTRIRTSLPIVRQGKDGYELRCPFCSDQHLILPGVEMSCGTKIDISVSQEIYPARIVKHQNLTCVKCFQGGGEMVRYRNSYVHLEECKPEARLLQEIPDSSRIAEFIYKLPAWIKPHFEKFTGHTDRVLEIDETGKKTGKVLAYIFWSVNGESKPATS